MSEFKFHYLFELYKDRSISSSKVFRQMLKNKWNISDIRKVSDLYIKINNYQVNKYGSNIVRHSGLAREVFNK